MTKPAEAIRALVRKAGWSGEFDLRTIGGSGNNRVHQIASGPRVLLLKEYFQDAEDLRDRFITERKFYTFLWQAGVRRIPEPLGWDSSARLGLFEFISGS